MQFMAFRSLLACCLLPLALACSGPRLKLSESVVTVEDSTRGILSWQCVVENSNEGQNLFCNRTRAYGSITVQAYLAKTEDPNEPDRVPAGGIVVVPADERLEPGERRRTGLGHVDTHSHLAPYTYLVLQVATGTPKNPTPKPHDYSENTSCCHYFASVALPLR